MESKDQVDGQVKQAANVNIDINEENGVKNLDLDASTESRVGLSKEELMKYANQPFWVRLRNILFAAFWILWLSILVAAVAYVINSPGCKMASAASVTSNTTTTTAAPST